MEEVISLLSALKEKEGRNCFLSNKLLVLYYRNYSS